MSAVESPDPARTPSAILRQWVAGVTAGKDAVVLDELVAAAVVRFKHDREFTDALVEEIVPELLPEITRMFFAQQRQAGKRMIPLGRDHVSQEKFDEMVTARAARWYEHVGADKRVSLLAMTKDDLIFSAERRESRAASELQVARFERDLADGLAEGQVVRDRYTPSELDEKWRLHFGDSDAPVLGAG